MAGKTEREQEERGLSARHLILLFLAGVAVCGVFFSLGFLVGYNERASRLTPSVERISEPSVIPPTVNIPSENVQSGAKSPSAMTTAPPRPSASSGGEGRDESTEKADSRPSAAASAPSKAVASESSSAKLAAAGGSIPFGPNGEVGVGFTVQVAATRTKEDAQKLVEVLKARSYPVFLVTPEYAKANDNLFRVQVGPFTTREDAEKVKGRLSQEGFKPFIRH